MVRRQHELVTSPVGGGEPTSGDHRLWRPLQLRRTAIGGGGTNAAPSVVFGRVGACRLQGNVVSLPTSGPQNVNLVVTAK